MRCSNSSRCAMALATLLATLVTPLFAADTLPGTQSLTLTGDLSAQMVAGIDRFLDRELEASVAKRAEFWKRDFTSPEAYEKSVAANREHLRKFIGAVDKRVVATQFEFVGGTRTPSKVAETDKYVVHAVRWPVFEGVNGEGLLLEPKGNAIASIIALPDADQTPEQLCGLAPGIQPESQFARRLAEHGCRVLVPVLLSREDTFSGSTTVNRWTNLPHREWIWRMAYELGRNPIGYEAQKVFAAADLCGASAGGA